MNGWSKWQKRKVALMGLERQLKSYSQLSEHYSWSRLSDYHKLFNSFWTAILEQRLLEECMWTYHETIRPENIDVQGKEDNTLNYSFCSIFTGNVELFLETLIDDLEDEEAYLLLFWDYIICWLNEMEENKGYETGKYYSNRLIQAEMKNQSIDMVTAFHINNFKEVDKWRMNVRGVLTY